MTLDEAARAWDKAEREGTLKGDPVPADVIRDPVHNKPVAFTAIKPVNRITDPWRR